MLVCSSMYSIGLNASAWTCKLCQLWPVKVKRRSPSLQLPAGLVVYLLPSAMLIVACRRQLTPRQAVRRIGSWWELGNMWHLSAGRGERE